MKCWSLAMSIKLCCFYLWWWNMIVIGLWPRLLSQIQITGTRCVHWIPDLYLCVINLYMITEKDGQSYPLSVGHTKRMTTPEEHKELSETEATANQGQPSLIDNSPKKCKRRRFLLQCSPPSETFLRLTATWSLKSDHWCPLSFEDKTGARWHFQKGCQKSPKRKRIPQESL